MGLPAPPLPSAVESRCVGASGPVLRAVGRSAVPAQHRDGGRSRCGAARSAALRTRCLHGRPGTSRGPDGFLATSATSVSGNLAARAARPLSCSYTKPVSFARVSSAPLLVL